MSSLNQPSKGGNDVLPDDSEYAQAISANYAQDQSNSKVGPQTVTSKLRLHPSLMNLVVKCEITIRCQDWAKEVGSNKGSEEEEILEVDKRLTILKLVL